MPIGYITHSRHNDDTETETNAKRHKRMKIDRVTRVCVSNIRVRSRVHCALSVCMLISRLAIITKQKKNCIKRPKSSSMSDLASYRICS